MQQRRKYNVWTGNSRGHQYRKFLLIWIFLVPSLLKLNIHCRHRASTHCWKLAGSELETYWDTHLQLSFLCTLSKSHCWMCSTGSLECKLLFKQFRMKVNYHGYLLWFTHPPGNSFSSHSPWSWGELHVAIPVLQVWLWMCCPVFVLTRLKFGGFFGRFFKF